MVGIFAQKTKENKKNEQNKIQFHATSKLAMALFT